MKTEFYKQCTMTCGASQTTAWIPEYGAKVGKRITLEDSEDPKKIWTVTTVGSSRISREKAQGMHGAGERLWQAGSLNGMRGNK